MCVSKCINKSFFNNNNNNDHHSNVKDVCLNHAVNVNSVIIMT